MLRRVKFKVSGLHLILNAGLDVSHEDLDVEGL